MQFSTTPNNFTPKVQQKWWDRFISQPHQPFFTASISFAFITMLGTFLSFLGKDVDFGAFHSFGLLFGVFTNAFLGFLFTVIPRYCASSPIEQKEYTTVWVIYQMSILLVLFDFTILGKLLCAFSLLYSINIFYINIKEGFGDKKESSILLFLLFLGASLLTIETLIDIDLTILIFYGYLLTIVFLVAFRMVPNFYSGYTQKPKWEKPKYTLSISLLLLFFIGITSQFEMLFLSKIVALLSLVFFGYIMFNLNIYGKTPPILAILVISFYWFYLAVFVHFIEVILEVYTFKLSFHIFALGFVLNLLIGFGSRVVMGHSIPPQKITADKLTVFVFILTQVVIVSRIVASVLFLQNSTIYMGFLHLSSWLWIVLFSIWSVRYAKTLLRIK